MSSECADLAAPSGPVRRRWQVWRSPDEQPAWARPALLAIAAAATVTYARNIANVGLVPFYSDAVRSMSESWKAFLYGAFDPKATITLDKLAGSFLPQAISARLFGFHPWSLALPEVIEGVISVLVMYRVVRRWAGAEAGLLAAGVFAAPPVAASMFGHGLEDAALTMCLVLAADATERAVLEGRLRSLAWAGLWVGAGFQAKMLQAWIVVPALAGAYLLAAPGPLRRRLWHLGAAGAVLMAASLSWIALYTVTPARDRPYIDGSTNNSAITMVFGYNGLERFGVAVRGSVVPMPGGALPGSVVLVAGGPRHQGFAMQAKALAQMENVAEAGAGVATGGWTKLLGRELGPEIGWLYPVAMLSLACGLVWYRRSGRTDPMRAGFVMWGSWLVSYGFVFSAMKVIPGVAYVASLAPPLAALSGTGIVLFWRAYLAGGHRGWMLPAAVGAEASWSACLWSSHRGFLPEALWGLIVAGAAALVIMVAARLTPLVPGQVVLSCAAAGVAAMLAAPTAWTGSVLDSRYDGCRWNVMAGPVAPCPGFGDEPAALLRVIRGGRNVMPSVTLDGAERRLYSYVSARRDGAAYLMAVDSWPLAEPYLLATGQEVLSIGGYTGNVPEPTLPEVARLVRSGQLRFFLLSAEPSWLPVPAGGPAAGEARLIAAWVSTRCSPVPLAAYAARVAEPTGTLYECDR